MHVFYTERHFLHATDQVVVDDHPFITDEVPQRAQILASACQGVYGPNREPEDHGLAPIRAVHDPDYLDFLSSIYSRTKLHFKQDSPVFPGTFARGPIRRKSNHVESLPGYYSYGVWSPILEGTWEAAYWSAQCALSAADELVLGSPAAYAICRPPGHHALPGLYGGFCYLNNAAIAARYLQNHGAMAQSSVQLPIRIAVLDIDYHHGNGTQEIFYQDPSVFFCSLHADPDHDYPYFWGASGEGGAGTGEGYNLNFPLPFDCDNVCYLSTLEKALIAIQKFNPQYLVVSLGLDTGIGDPVGGFSLTTPQFIQAGELVAGIQVPALIIQEGGYRIDHLAEWLLAFLSAFV